MVERLRTRTPIAEAAAEAGSLALADTTGDSPSGRCTAERPVRRPRRHRRRVHAGRRRSSPARATERSASGPRHSGSARAVRTAGPVAAISAARDRFVTRAPNGSVRVYALDGSLLRTLRAHAAARNARTGRSGRRDDARARGRPLGHSDRQAPPSPQRPPLTRHRRRVLPRRPSVVTASDDHDARLWDVGERAPAARPARPLLRRAHAHRSARRAGGSSPRVSSPPVSGTPPRARSSCISRETRGRSPARPSARTATGSSPAARTARRGSSAATSAAACPGWNRSHASDCAGFANIAGRRRRASRSRRGTGASCQRRQACTARRGSSTAGGPSAHRERTSGPSSSGSRSRRHRR